MRAGAINWGIKWYAEGYDYVLAMDADSMAGPNMIKEGVAFMEAHLDHSMVCSRAGVLPQPELKGFMAKALWHIQNVEYGQYDSSRVETTGKIKVAHGLSTMYRKSFLDEQYKALGYIYNVNALAEDLDLTMDAKLRGWKVSSCQKMEAYTIVPTRLRWLLKQRTRWMLGGIDSIISHGFNWVTFWDIFAHVTGVICIGIEVFIASLIIYLWAQGEPIYLSPLFFAVMGAMLINGTYRLRYCQNKSVWSYVVVLSLVPLTLFYYLNVVALWKAYYQYLTNAKRTY
jgi:cellulose synthase/poly-beta-1,6-N-acetylglucosamine synthase-like glycosyltransferase